jgi:fructokinase
VVTLGPDGAYYRTKGGRGLLKAYPVKTIDTTGAGDSFLGALHHCLAGKSLDDIDRLTDSDWQDNIRFCNAAGSLATTAKGAIPAMPSMEQIKSILESLSNIYCNGE